MKSNDGLAATLLLPAEVSFTYDGAEINCICKTDYPFKGEIKYIITTDKPIEFDFAIRIPSFASSAIVNGNNVNVGEFYHIKKQWTDTEEVNIALDFVAELVKRPSGMYFLERGPLLYALPIKAKKVMHEYEKDGVKRSFPYSDYELFPESKWNYGFTSNTISITDNDVSEVPFSSANPPLYINVEVAEVDWSISNGVCTEKPSSLNMRSQPQIKRFIPYGCTELRMTELPILF